MDILGQGLIAIGSAVGAWATAFGFIYIVGIAAKTFLIYMDKAKVEDFKGWFDFGFRKDKGL